LGDRIIAIQDKYKRLFPDRPKTVVTVSTGLGICLGHQLTGAGHGAGDMAGHVAFGARTRIGGASIILSGILILIALFLSGSVEIVFQLLPAAVLGIVLFLTDAQLALVSFDLSEDKRKHFITRVTIAFAIWNVGLVFLVGRAGHYIDQRNWLWL